MSRPTLVPLVTVTLLALPVGCGRDAPPQEPELRPVRYERVFMTGGTRDRTFSGTAQAGLESRLSFKVRGSIRELGVKVGDQVRAGQIIASLDRRDYELQVQEAEAALANATAQQRNADASLERVRGLYENDNASKSDLDAAIAAAESAAAQVESARKRLQQAELQLSYTSLTAPTGGAIAEVPVEVNENISPGDTIAVLTSSGRAEVTVTIPEQLITQVKEDDAVSVRFDAIPDRSFGARVREVAVAATGVGTTFPVTVRLDDASPGVRPGMAAEVTFTFDSSSSGERITVPAFAVGEDPDGRFVFVVEKDGEGTGIVRRRDVQVGELTEEGRLVVDRGIADGDLVVTAGVSRIEDGMTVRVLEGGGLGS
jgi:RND family efflux transporter MFP subunit